MLGSSSSGEQSLNLQSISSESLGSNYVTFSNALETELSGLLSVQLKGLEKVHAGSGTDVKQNEIVQEG
jgi:hypothetical protein